MSFSYGNQSFELQRKSMTGFYMRGILVVKRFNVVCLVCLGFRGMNAKAFTAKNSSSILKCILRRV